MAQMVSEVAVAKKRCGVCGVKFHGSMAESHVPGSDDCIEWYRDRMEHERYRD